MDEAIEEGFDALDALDIPDDALSRYHQPSEEDSERPVYIDPGVYKGQLIEWGKVYNPMFKKYSLEMTFALGNERLKGWFNIEKSNSDTLVKAGWKSDFLRMYQEVFDVRLERRDRMAPNNFMGKPLALEVVSIEQDAHKNPLAKVNHYSRVKKIVGLLEDELA